MKTIVTMTSWTKRIHCVAKSIYTFFKTQMEKPDVFYLWLAIEEFPNKEKDLPEDLLAIIDAFNVQLRWVEKNTYCHKRWNVFPEHMQDLVIAIDDDVIYSPVLISMCKYQAQMYPNAVFCHVREWVAIPVYNNTIHHQIWRYTANPAEFDKLFFCGQCCFPPNTFPESALKDHDKRDEICPICDEAWIISNLLADNKYHICLQTTTNMIPRVVDNTQNVGIVNTYNVEKAEGSQYTKKDVGIYKALQYRNVLDKWRELHPDYGTL